MRKLRTEKITLGTYFVTIICELEKNSLVHSSRFKVQSNHLSSELFFSYLARPLVQ